MCAKGVDGVGFCSTWMSSVVTLVYAVEKILHRPSCIQPWFCRQIPDSLGNVLVMVLYTIHLCHKCPMFGVVGWVFCGLWLLCPAVPVGWSWNWSFLPTFGRPIYWDCIAMVIVGSMWLWPVAVADPRGAWEDCCWYCRGLQQSDFSMSAWLVWLHFVYACVVTPIGMPPFVGPTSSLQYYY
jgi:hypothetical protein